MTVFQVVKERLAAQMWEYQAVTSPGLARQACSAELVKEGPNAKSQSRWLEDVLPGPQVPRTGRMPDLMEEKSRHRRCPHQAQTTWATPG